MSTNLKQVAQQALAALEYHQAQTRPIHQTQEAIGALRAGLHAQAEISDYDLLVVTTAYEQGFGHAFRAEINNPYKPGIPAAKAWDMGRAAGRRQGEPAGLAPSVHEDNARLLQAILDEMRETLWAPPGASITGVLRKHMREAKVMHDALEYLSNLHPRRCNLAEVTRAREAIERYRELFQPSIKEPT